MSINKLKKLVVLGTGGTIAGTASDAHDNVGYTAAQIGVAQLVQAIPALAELPCELVCEQVAQIDSKDMSFAVWQKLLARTAHWLADTTVQGVVITHGTDTLEETAFFLQCALPRDLLAAKPVVLTCAMRPATALNADGPQNICDAIAVALTPGAQGVIAVCAGTVHTAMDVQKTHTYRLNAFSSGDAGPLGYVEEGSVRLLRNWPEATVSTAYEAISGVADENKWPRVEIVMNHAGAGALVVDALLAQSASGQVAPLRGVVVAGTGNGTLHHDLEAALLRAQAQGVTVRRSTRCAMGRVIATPDAAIAHSEGLSPVKARIALMLELMASD
jgi:L-asparaginase